MTRPILTVDMDGVLAAPPLGLPNVAISRRLLRGELPTRVERIDRDGLPPTGHLVAWAQWLRYGGRRPLPGVAEGLAAMAGRRELVLVTGRSWQARPLIEAWLERHGLRGYFAAIYANNTRLTTAQFKLWMARQLDAQEHVDDDGSIAYYLAHHGLRRVFLRTWWRNRGLPYPPHVIVVGSLVELAEHLAREDGT
ncbi:MAG: hypothetical protein HY690_05165 [Chloroflexi bacterium]|nr:hypothetical protein [Chloroflexota bacterium]